MLLKGAYCVGEHFVDPQGTYLELNTWHLCCHEPQKKNAFLNCSGIQKLKIRYVGMGVAVSSSFACER